MRADHPDAYPASRGRRPAVTAARGADGRRAHAALVLLATAGSVAGRLRQRGQPDAGAPAAPRARLAVRAALGAGRLRLFRELLVEAALCWRSQALAGLGPGRAGLPVAGGLVEGFTPRGTELAGRPGARRLVRAAGAGQHADAGAVPAFALAPDRRVAQAGRPRRRGPRGVRARAGWSSRQLAFAFVVLVGLAQRCGSLARLGGVCRVHGAQRGSPPALARLDEVRRRAQPRCLPRAVLAELRELPGCHCRGRAAGRAAQPDLPVRRPLPVEGRDVAADAPLPRRTSASPAPDYFRARLARPRLHGRRRRRLPRVAPRQRGALARREWRGQDLLGRCFA